MDAGEVAILNVGAGDIRLSFNPDDDAERVRAARIVKDMLRGGYALLVEVEKDGKKAFQRVKKFRDDTCEYVIADYDPGGGGVGAAHRPKPVLRERAIPAKSTRAVAVSRSAGG